MADISKKDNSNDNSTIDTVTNVIKIKDIFFLASLYIDQKRFKEAIELYEYACRIYPENLSLRVNLGKVLELKDQHEFSLMKEIDDKISQKRKTDDLFANHYYGLGVRFLKRKNLDKAAEYLQLATYKNPVFSKAYLRLGELYYQQGNYDDSQIALEKAKKLNRFDERIYAVLGEVYLKKELFRRALEAFVDAAILSGKNLKDTPYQTNIKKSFKKVNFSSKETISRYLADRNEKFNNLMEALEKQRVRDQKGFEDYLKAHRQQESKATAGSKELLLKKVKKFLKYDYFTDFTEADMLQLFSIAQEQKYEAGKLIFNESSLGTHFYIVETGKIVIYRDSPAGEIVYKEFGQGEFFGEVGLIDSMNRSANAKAVASSSLICVNKNNLGLLLDSHKELAVKMYWMFWKSLSNNLRSANAMMNKFFAMVEEQAKSKKQIDKDEPARHELEEKIPIEKKMTALADKGLSPQDLNLIAMVSDEEFYHADELIFREGDSGSKLYVILSGKVRISKITPGGGEEALAVLTKGDFFGEMAIIDDSPRSADARAHEDFTIVLTIEKKDLQSVLSSDVDRACKFLKILCKILSKRLREVNDTIRSWYIMSGQFM